MKNYFKFIPAVYLVLIKNGSILLLRRHNTGYQDGNYSLIAGHLDGNEPLTTAMTREAQEEAGIDIDPKDLTLVHTMHMRSELRGSTDDERINIYFAAKAYNGEPRNTEPHKCDDLRWFDLNSLPQNIIPHVRVALEHIRNNRSYSEFGWDNRKDKIV